MSEISYLMALLFVAGVLTAIVVGFLRHLRCGFEYCDEGLLVATATGHADLNGVPFIDNVYSGKLLTFTRGSLTGIRLVAVVSSLLVAFIFSATFIQLLNEQTVWAPSSWMLIALIAGYFGTVSFLRLSLVPATPAYGFYAGVSCVLGTAATLAAAVWWPPLGLLAGVCFSVLLFSRPPGMPAVALLICLLIASLGGGLLVQLLWIVSGGVVGIALHFILLLSPAEYLRRFKSAIAMQRECSTQLYGSWDMVRSDVAYIRTIVLISLKTRWYFLPGMFLLPLLLPEGIKEGVAACLLILAGVLFMVKNHAAMEKVQPNEALVMRPFLDLFWLVLAYRVGDNLALGRWTGQELTLLAVALLFLGIALGHSLLSWHQTMRNTHYVAELWAAPVLLAACSTPAGGGHLLLIGVVVVCSLHVFLRFQGGWLNYPLAYDHSMPKKACTTPVNVASGGKYLLLPEDHARFIEAVRQAAQKGGFQPGDSVMPCFNYLGMAYFLDGKMPWTPYFIYHPQTRDLELLGSWIIDNAPAEARSAFILDFHPEQTVRFLHAMALPFPDGYEKLYSGHCPLTGEIFNLWKPKPENDYVQSGADRSRV